MLTIVFKPAARSVSATTSTEGLSLTRLSFVHILVVLN